MPPKLTALGKWKQQKGHAENLTFIVCGALHSSCKYLHKFLCRY